MDNIGFKLSLITTEEFEIVESNFDNEGKVKLELAVRFAADSKQKLIAVFSKFSFSTNDASFLLIEGGCHFAIPDDSWKSMLNYQQNSLTIPKGFSQQMAQLTVGTTRGLLHAKTENTPFNHFHIPLINIANLIKEDNILKLNN